MRRNIGLKIGAFALACSMFLGNFSLNIYAEGEPQENKVKIGLLSDTHYFSKSLYSDCDDFTTAINSDRKMLKESDAILTTALNDMVQDAPDFVLISGDLTKDGEQVNHEAVAQKLTQAKEELAQKGVDTNFYVINGNHDINNPNGKDFSSGHAEDADRTTVEEFKEIYKDFGYGEDSVQYSPDGNRGGSLSYVTRPAEGYTLIAVDSGKYSSDQTASGQDLQETSGVIGADLLNWITAQAQQAKQRGDVVMVVQHHGVVPHFGMEPAVMSEYLVDNWQDVQTAYADAGVSYVFTGHMHANDISSYTSPNGNVLYDIETGSLLTYPSLMREAVIEKGTFENDKSSTIQVETKKPGVVYYTDFDTGELKEITDITEYGKQHTLSNDVIKTMISEGLLTPMFKDTLEKGGVKTVIADLLGIEDYTQVAPYITETITGMLPADKENGLQVSTSGFTFSIYYDAQSEQIKIDELTEKAICEAQEENVIRFAMEDGDIMTVTLPEELEETITAQINELAASEQAEACDVEARGMLDPIMLIAAKTSITNFIDEFLANVDQELLAQPNRVFEVLNMLIDEILNANVDDEHTVFELVNYVYQTHLLGNEVCEPWAETAMTKIKEESFLNDVFVNAIQTTQPAVKEALTVLPIDLSTVIEKGNDSIFTSIVHSGVMGMFTNGGDIVDMVDLSTFLPDSIVSQISELAYNVAYSMTHDDNFADDSKAAIAITRMLDETVFDANSVLDSAKEIKQENYTSESYQNVKNAMDQLENAVMQANAEAIKDAIAGLNQAVAALEKNITPVDPENQPQQNQPEQNQPQQNQPEQNQPQQNQPQQNQSQQNQPEQNQPQQNQPQNTGAATATKSVQTGDTMNVIVAVAVVAAVLEVVLYQMKKRKNV